MIKETSFTDLTDYRLKQHTVMPAEQVKTIRTAWHRFYKAHILNWMKEHRCPKRYSIS